MNYEDCMVFLSHCQKDIELDSQTLMEAAFSFKITKSLLFDLELFYKIKGRKHCPLKSKILKAFNRLSLQEEDHPVNRLKKKHYWIILPATPDDMKEALKYETQITEEDIE